MIVWTAFTLPVMAALLSVYFTSEKRLLRLSSKGGATCVALATAIFSHLRSGALPSGGIIICAVALFALADILLDLKFFYGVAVFALGHIALIIWLIAQGSALHQPLFALPGFSAAACLYILAVFLFHKTIFKAGKITIAMLSYAAVLALMTGVSLILPFYGDSRYLFFALGASLFMLSDLMVAQGMLVGMARKWHILGMIIYESAVMLMALSA